MMMTTSMISDEAIRAMNNINSMLPELFGRWCSYNLDDEIGRRVDSGKAEEERLTKMAMESGAQPGEFMIQWRWRRGVGAWPYLR